MRTALQVSVSFKGQPIGTRIYAGDRILIGRDSDCDVRLRNLGVSRHHARIDRQGQGYLLRDMESAQGIRAGEKPIDSLLIQDGDQVQITKFSLLFRVIEVADAEGDTDTVAGGLGEMETLRDAASGLAVRKPGSHSAVGDQGTGWSAGQVWLAVGVVVVLGAAIAFIALR